MAIIVPGISKRTCCCYGDLVRFVFRERKPRVYVGFLIPRYTIIFVYEHTNGIKSESILKPIGQKVIE